MAVACPAGRRGKLHTLREPPRRERSDRSGGCGDVHIPNLRDARTERNPRVGPVNGLKVGTAIATPASVTQPQGDQ